MDGPTPHWYDDDNRRTQLETMRKVCACLAEVFGQHHDEGRARAYASVAGEAAVLLLGAFSHDHLKGLAAAVPERPEWLHPKFFNFTAPRVPWQEEAAGLNAVALRTAIELRALATYESA
jgi:hypothetical protein